MVKTGVVCQQCNYQFPRATNPEFCPNCWTIHWDKPKHERQELTKEPKVATDKNLRPTKIKRQCVCGHVWRQPIGSPYPRWCPKCRSVKWNEPTT